jgi:transcriptional regulator NrdR family protein
MTKVDGIKNSAEKPLSIIKKNEKMLKFRSTELFYGIEQSVNSRVIYKTQY